MATYTLNTGLATSDSGITVSGHVNGANLTGQTLSIRDTAGVGSSTQISSFQSSQVDAQGNFTFSVDYSNLQSVNQFSIGDTHSLDDSSTFVNVNSNNGPYGASINQQGAHELRVDYTNSVVIDGYIAGATSFDDTNNNGILDNGEMAVVSDANGNFKLVDTTGGQIVSTGGTDTSTGLKFTGVLTAPAGSTVVTSLTTLVNQIAQSNGGNVASAQSAVAAALGLPTGLDLTTLDPIAATQAGTAGAASALAASAALNNTAALFAASGSGSSLYAALAQQIASGSGPIDLTNASTVSALASAAGVGSSAADAIGQIAAASNAAIAAAVQADGANAAALLSDLNAISTVAQGSTATAIGAAGGDASQLAQVVFAYTGSSLADSIASAATAAGSTGIVTTGPTNNSISPAQQAQIAQDFLAAAFANVGTVPVTYLSGTSLDTVTNLNTSVGILTPGSNATLNVTTDAALLVSGGSTVDLSGSPALNAAGRHLGLNITVADGNNTIVLNKGPTMIQSVYSNDTIISSGGHDTLSSGFGQDSLVGGGHSLLLGGGGGNDTLHGGLTLASRDTILAGIGGSNRIVTNVGHNLVFGGSNDTIFAGYAHDTVAAGDGPETIHGGLASTIYGNGQSVMDRGHYNNYNLTGADTLYGSNSHNNVSIGDGSNGVVVDGTTGSGTLDVAINTTGQGNDTLFGGTSADGTGSNLTVHVSTSFTEGATLDANGLHTIQLAGGPTLHVNNVTIDFNGTKTNV